jgi:hypothetical protein
MNLCVGTGWICMIGSVCNEEGVAKRSFMGFQWGDYGDLCEGGERGESESG